MSERAHNIIKAIVIDNDWTKLRPLQMARVTQMHKWIYDPDPDFKKEFDDGLYTIDLPMRLIAPDESKSGFPEFWVDEKDRRWVPKGLNLNDVLDFCLNPRTIDYTIPNQYPDLTTTIIFFRTIVMYYNQWVDFKNKEFASQIVSTWEPSEDGESGDVDYDKIEGKEYSRMYVPPLWQVDVETISPKVSGVAIDFEDVPGLYSFESEPLYRAMKILGEEKKEEFLLMLNVMLFDHISDMRKLAEEAGDWNKENIYWLPNKEFVRYFQEKGINPSKVTRFEEHPNHRIKDMDWDDYPSSNDPYTEKSMRRIFGGHHEFTDDDFTLKDLACRCRDVYEENNYHFNSLRDVYREATNWWKLFGVGKSKQSQARPKDGMINWFQLEKALHK